MAFGGLTVGALDLLDAIVFFGLRNGVAPVRIPQSIAAGLVGRPAAVAGGLSTAALGVALHFFIATTIVAVFYLANGLSIHVLGVGLPSAFFARAARAR